MAPSSHYPRGNPVKPSDPLIPRPLDDYHEDYGFVTWWTWRDGAWLGEPSWIGSPHDSDWPGYHTHFTPHPPFPNPPMPRTP